MIIFIRTAIFIQNLKKITIYSIFPKKKTEQKQKIKKKIKIRYFPQLMENFNEYPPKRIAENPQKVIIFMNSEERHHEIANSLKIFGNNSFDFITCRIDSPILKRKESKGEDRYTPSHYKPGWIYYQLRKHPCVIVIFLDGNKLDKETVKKLKEFLNERYQEKKLWRQSNEKKVMPKLFIVSFKKQASQENIDPNSNNWAQDFLHKTKKRLNLKVIDCFMHFDEMNPRFSLEL